MHLKHIVAAVTIALTWLYIQQKDFTPATMFDYIVSVAIVIMLAYMYARLVKQTNAEQKHND